MYHVDPKQKVLSKEILGQNYYYIVSRIGYTLLR